jgi:hypothetical protein
LHALGRHHGTSPKGNRIDASIVSNDARHVNCVESHSHVEGCLFFRFRLVAIAAIVSTTLAACGGGGSSSSPTVAATPSPIVPVSLTKAWTDTGFAVTAGESITITATGSMNNGQCAGTECTYTPAGRTSSSTCTGIAGGPFTAPNLNCWSLIGKIGSSGTPFEVGTSLQTTASTGGELFLGVNDNDFGDNSGSWTATITL